MSIFIIRITVHPRMIHFSGQKFAIVEMKIVIAWTLRRFKLRAAVHRDKLHVQAEMVTRSRDGLHIYVESRTDSQ